MLMTTSAPLSAWSAMGPVGFQASSQIDTPTGMPRTE